MRKAEAKIIANFLVSLLEDRECERRMDDDDLAVLLRDRNFHDAWQESKDLMTSNDAIVAMFDVMMTNLYGIDWSEQRIPDVDRRAVWDVASKKANG